MHNIVMAVCCVYLRSFSLLSFFNFFISCVPDGSEQEGVTSKEKVLGMLNFRAFIDSGSGSCSVPAQWTVA